VLSDRVASWLAALDEGAPLSEVLAQLPEHFGYEAIRVLEMHDGAGEVIFSSGRLPINSELIASLGIFGHGVLGQAVREGRIIEARDYAQHPAAMEAKKDVIKSVLAVPLRSSGSNLGALVLLNDRERHPGLSEEQMRELRVMQSVISAHLAVRKVERRVERQQGLLEFANQIHSVKHLEHLVPMLFKSMSEYLDYSAITLTLVEGNAYRIFYAVGSKGHAPSHFGVTIADPERAPLTRQILETGEPLLIGDAADPVIKSFYQIGHLSTDPDDPDIRSYMGTLLSYGELRGVLSVQSEEAWKYGLSEMEYLNALARVLSFGLERVRWYALDRAAKRLARLGWTDENIEGFPGQVLRTLEDLWSFEVGAVYLRRGDEGPLYRKAASRERMPLPDVIDPGGVVGEEPVLFRSRDQLPERLAPLWTDDCSGGMLLPIPDGFIWLASELGFTDWDLRMARSLARELYLPFERLRQHVKLRDEASLDPLTGVFNRRKLEERLRRMIALSNRYGDTFTVVVVDMYNFGEVNNRHGHLVGDKVLARVARVLKENMREGDDVFRMGGDEFVMVLRRSGKKEAVKAALRCASALIQDDVLRRHGVTANFGLAEYREGDTPESLLEAADREMYAAKARRVSVLGTPSEGG